VIVEDQEIYVRVYWHPTDNDGSKFIGVSSVEETHRLASIG